MRVTATHKARLFRMKSDKIDDEPAEGSPDLIIVQFNPNSLSYTAQNTLEKKGRDANASQFVAQTSAKLEFDLIFDTTHDGGDVRKETDRIKRFLDTNPENKSKPPSEPAPPMVGFRWGSFKFKGMLESFRETLDYFSSEGVPLRSAVKIAMSSLNSRDAFLQQKFADGDVSAMGGEGVKLATVPARGAPSRPTAAANGMESMRNPGAGLMAVAGAAVELKAAASFSAGASAGFGAGAGAGFGAGAGAGFGASAGAGFGASAGAGFGASAGAGFGASAGAGFGGGAGAGFGSAAAAGFGASAGASAGFGASSGAGFSAGTSFSSASAVSSASFGSSSIGAGPFGSGALGSSGGGFGFASASASRGVSASMGAFAGLGPSRTSPAARVEFQFTPPQPVIASASANFSVGGKVSGTASAGLKADVGTNTRIHFD